VADLLYPSRSENDDSPLPPRPSERTPPSSSLTSPLSLARELAQRLRQHQDHQGEAWRLACALSLSIVDLLESMRASDATGDEAGADSKTTATGRDPFTR
jgi:hypothetical protein